MARPIEPTPVLRGKDAKAFEAKIESDLKIPSHPTPTPKLEAARKLVKNQFKELAENK